MFYEVDAEEDSREERAQNIVCLILCPLTHANSEKNSCHFQHKTFIFEDKYSFFGRIDKKRGGKDQV